MNLAGIDTNTFCIQSVSFSITYHYYTAALKRLTWRDVYEIVLPYRRLADLETPILWLSMIYKEEHIGYHNEVSFYRSVCLLADPLLVRSQIL